MSWTAELSDKSFTPLGQFVNLHELKTDIPLNKVRTAQLTMRLDNPLAFQLATKAELEPMYIKLRRNGSVIFHGPVMTVQEAGDENLGATLQVNASGPEIIFTQRLLVPGMVYTNDAGIKT
jgi:hypothetical protein